MSTGKYARVNVVVPILALVVAMTANMLGQASAADADPLQDFCVADLQAPARGNVPAVDGYPCKSPETITLEDFAYSGLSVPGNASGDPLKGVATFARVREWPALNTQGLSLVRLDLNPGGIIMPHTHALATEIIYCLEGEIYTGFVTNSDNRAIPNKVFAKIVKPGEAYIFPRGLLHFQLNKGPKKAVSINVLNSQNPGFQFTPMALFASGIDPQLLASSFFISEDDVQGLAGKMSDYASTTYT